MGDRMSNDARLGNPILLPSFPSALPSSTPACQPASLEEAIPQDEEDLRLQEQKMELDLAAETNILANTVPLSRKIERLRDRLFGNKATWKALESSAEDNHRRSAIKETVPVEQDDFRSAKLPRSLWLPKDRWSDLHEALPRYLDDKHEHLPVENLATDDID
ncbi:hypothetical protein DFQ26_004238 [Actinomortierella ambigua]|nr:hypothetical protein DFQ26_004238 [Actinomortierella ambigua]